MRPDGSPEKSIKLSLSKKRFWKIPLIVFCFLCPLAAWLGFGERGLIHLYKAETERQACVDRIHKLAEENQVLLEEIHRLRTDMKYIESVARKELNLIGPNQIIYRFDTNKPLETQHNTGNEKPERKAWDDGKIK